MAETLKTYGLPVVTFVVVIALWEASLDWFGIPAYLLPRPGAVLSAMQQAYFGGTIWIHVWATLQAMLGGFVLGCSFALLAGGLVAEFRTVERLVYPYVIALQSMPKVALAPLLIVWLGFGIASKVVLVALICFFPMFVNVVVGLRSANPDLVDLYRACSASRWHLFVNVKLPSAASAIFAGLQVALVLALLGAVVGEFVASQRGLGNLIQASSLNFDVATMFASIFTLAIIGVTASSLVRFAHRRIVFWDGSGRRTATTTTTAETA
ncbi:ABC transporter permease [Falsiroseomonas oryzae]|uniref:ABC transporter permease n=1 Tax=Falsiroseomonas oryzae TaxID=2766473 RepID=UPI0022EA31C6|nr:ABC transporter permease [Roseomonas sp. MO-31]